MTRDDFEHKLLELWMKTRIPLTRTHVHYYTRVPRKKAELWLDELVRDELLEMIVGNDGEVYWRFPGARRPVDGPTTFEAFEGASRGPSRGGVGDALDKLDRAASTALAVREVRSELTRKGGDGRKSYLWSGALSLFLGPLGWLYAGAWKEAIPASLVFAFFVWLLPGFLLGSLLGVGLPASALVGLMYAWKHNKVGERRPILDWDKEKGA